MSSRRFTRQAKLMGCSFELGLVSDNGSVADLLLDSGIAEISRIERMLTEFDPNSLTCQLNNSPNDQFLEVPDEFTGLLVRCLGIHKLTKGYFDLTVAPLKALYRFENNQFQMPTKSAINRAMEQAGMDRLEIEASSVRNNGASISFASIGKGYAADRVKELWVDQGVKGGYVNASGDLSAFGLTEAGNKWSIGIANPHHPASNLLHIPISEAAVATSGDYEQHFLYQGERYSHNINPKTGLPVSGVSSITIVSPSAELSDALATAVHAMGIRKGIQLIDQLPQTHMIGITSDGTVHLSKHLDYASIA